MGTTGNIGFALIIIIIFNFAIGFIIPALVKSVVILGLDLTGFVRSALFTIINLFWLMMLRSDSFKEE
ncbi:MAG: hypothetical protein E3J52_10370 [Promethearchaeota archaeon]|nr:MAG: hypothetical protein E3J52_10370 [Candidatus Lokiarchaeota archaeon]